MSECLVGSPDLKFYFTVICTLLHFPNYRKFKFPNNSTCMGVPLYRVWVCMKFRVLMCIILAFEGH